MQFSISIKLAIFVVFISVHPSRQSQQLSDGSLSDRTSERKVVSVRGELFCGNSSTTDVRVKLWASDTDLERAVLEPSNLLDSKRFRGHGRFELKGSNENDRNIAVFDQPVLTIDHNCDYDNEGKMRRVLIKVPSSYIGNDRLTTKQYYIGTLNLELEYPKETHEEIEKIDNLNAKWMLMKIFFF